MLEDPKITRDILEYFARDDVGFPANVMVQRELAGAFPENDLSVLQYHVLCALKSDLLMVASYDVQDRHDGVDIRFGHVIGLTAKGGNYVRDARTTFWDKAATKIGDAGLNMTTDRLVEVIADLAAKALQT